LLLHQLVDGYLISRYINWTQHAMHEQPHAINTHHTVLMKHRIIPQ
jgi:hypothetical protein